jgi:hypothetical protein
MATEYKNSFEEEKAEREFFVELLEFIGSNDKLRTFLHTTEEESTCKFICTSGFEYENWGKTTDQIAAGDAIDIRWKLTIRKAYGDFTLVIQMAKRNIDDENFRTDRVGSNGDPVDMLPPQLVKGYFNKKTRTITKNPDFDPWFTTIKT